jgi:hypothetical protein
MNRQQVTVLEGMEHRMEDRVVQPDAMLVGKIHFPEGKRPEEFRIHCQWLGKDPEKAQRLKQQKRYGGPMVWSGKGSRFEIHSLLPGFNRLWVEAEGFGPGFPLTVEIVPGQVRKIVLNFRQGHVLKGRVIDAAGKPVAKTKVRVTRDSKERDPGDFSSIFVDGLTDAEGRFQIAGLQRGRYGVSVSWEKGHGGGSWTADLPGDSQETVFKVPASVALRGRVVCDFPIRGQQGDIHLYQMERNKYGTLCQRLVNNVRIDEGGEFCIWFVPQEIQVYIELSGERTEVNVWHELRVRLLDPVSKRLLEGKVIVKLENGNPVPVEVPLR